MHFEIRDYWTTHSAPLKGLLDFMYLRVRGWVSTLVGNNIDETAHELSAPPNRECSSSLQLANEVRWTVGEQPVTEDEIAAAWNVVEAPLNLALQRHHKVFENLPDLRLSIDEINQVVLAKLDNRMEQFLVGRPEFANFQNWPVMTKGRA
jgi:hypothetical protein